MAEPLNLQQAVRFLQRAYLIAVKNGNAKTLTKWVSVTASSPEYRAVRRGICLQAIRDVNDDPKRDIFAAYPGPTEDLYYQAALDAFLPVVRRAAEVDALATLNRQEVLVGQIALQVRDPTIALRLHAAAVKVRAVGRTLDMPLSDKRQLPALTAKEYEQLLGPGRASDPIVERLRRTTYMREVRRPTGDPLLGYLMASPNGVEIVNALALQVAAGQRAAAQTLNSCVEAIREMRMGLMGDASFIWKFRPPLGPASAKVAGMAGQPGAAVALTSFSLAWAEYLKGKVQSALDIANNAVMALALLGPVGAVAGDILGVVLAAIGAAVSLLDEIQQDQAAMATTFADDASKLSKGGKTNVVAVKAVASVLGAIAPFGLARVLGRSARSGAAVAREVEGTAAGEARAATRPEGGATQIASPNRGLGPEPAIGPASPGTSSARVSDTTVSSLPEGQAGRPARQAAPLDAAPTGTAPMGTAPELGGKPASAGTPVEQARGTAKPATSLVDAKTGGQGGKRADLDTEFVDGAHRDPSSLSKVEVDKARKTVVDDFVAASTKPLKPLNYAEVALPEQQKETFGRLASRLFSDQAQLAAPQAASAARAALLRAAEADAANLRRRLAAHWSNALPRSGQTAEQAAMDLLDAILKEMPTDSASKTIRKKFFNRWRNRFLDSVGSDPQLVNDLRTQAGVIFNRHAGEGGNAFGVPFRNKDGVSLVGLDVDHAVIGHSEAVADALRTRDPQKLVSTVDAKNLQLLTERENRNFIEVVRADTEKWIARPQNE